MAIPASPGGPAAEPPPLIAPQGAGGAPGWETAIIALLISLAVLVAVLVGARRHGAMPCQRMRRWMPTSNTLSLSTLALSLNLKKHAQCGASCTCTCNASGSVCCRGWPSMRSSR